MRIQPIQLVAQSPYPGGVFLERFVRIKTRKHLIERVVPHHGRDQLRLKDLCFDQIA